MSITLPPFDPADLKPIRDLYLQGKLGTLKLRYVLELCRQRRFPCVKIGNVWHTTEPSIRHFLWAHASPDFKKINS